MIYILISAVSYLLGSIPFGFIAGRVAGVDITRHGSGNIGATNVLRVLGRQYGYAVFVGDACKGLVAVEFATWLAQRVGGTGYGPGVLAAICAVLGHSFPVWLRFRGGKGVATSAGACFGLIPLAATVVALVWIVTFFTSRFVSLASLTAACALPLAVWLLSPHDVIVVAFALLIAILVVLRHRTNIERLIRGTEPRFQRK